LLTTSIDEHFEVAVGFMDNAQKLHIVDNILERASELAGDITDSVLAEFYRGDPEARNLFTHHCPVDTIRLEAGMVEQALYCFMRWFQSPGEIRILLLGSVPHHVETLKVPVNYYHRFLQAMATVIRKTIPAENREEIDVWNEICGDLGEIVDAANQYVYRAERIGKEAVHG